ncbi:family 4 glycosyl hydrolase [Pseudoprimorskyibacter insulae]|uniref:Alpha-galacturonidase n=1 Tax=Pseudoprimorskyibacter insulae TaxID=1695997 RepID=A0A2R8B138_9RHOB|nr:alpha-galactosidase [Pseudoprimorskyibacter insulae]SPF81884.1 Alpha-galacturonidase [Pseudoprimorskyibacter insulae]
MQPDTGPIDVRIAYIGGGSLNWALGLMADLAQDTILSADVRLYDLDVDAARQNAALGARFAEVSRGTPARYSVCDTIGDALRDADIVVVSILPGSFDDMAQDILIPERYGIPQAVGDTVGPGGFVRALRSIPMLHQIGAAIAEHAPDAYVCNLTNPMSVLTGALYAAHPGIRCWGECHEVTKLRKQVAWLANRAEGGERWTHRDVEVNVLGVNHFTFVDKIALNGQDMMPAYRAFAAEFAEAGWTAKVPDPDDEFARYFEDRSRVKFDLTRRFGIAAAAGDRHLVEFLPAAEYLEAPANWDFGLTPVEFRIRDNKAKRARRAALLAGEAAVAPKRSDEALVDQIIALMGGAAHVSNVNLPNRGQISNLPQGAIVESNAMFSGLGVTPLMAGSLPEPLADHVRGHALRQSALLNAVIAQQYDVLFDLFRTDPLVAPLSGNRARQMFAEMIQATASRLPDALVKEIA